MTIVNKTLMFLYFGIACFFLGKFTYGIAPDSDGFGIFVPHIGGYHISLVNDEDSGLYW